jgi:hypothetical protein
MLTKKISKDQRILIFQQPLHQQFILHYSNTNGGVVLVHKLVDNTESDYELLIAIGTVLANEGKKIELLPKLHEKDVDFRRKVLPGARMNKNPDLRIDGEYWEWKLLIGLIIEQKSTQELEKARNKPTQ